MASLNFPANPSNGDVFENFTYNSDVGAWRRIGGSGAASITVSETAPTQGLSSGALWLDSTSGNTYIYYEDVDNAQWVQTSGPDLSATRGSDFTIQATAPANPVDGDIWYDPAEGFTYIYYEDVDSSQWVQFGLNRNGAPGADGSDGADGENGIGIPTGGTEGQALVKSSATDYAVEWGSVAGGGGLLTLDSDTINVDFNDSSSLYTRSVAGDVTFTGSDYTAGATKKIYLQGDTVQRTLTFPAEWNFITDKPTAIGADKKNILDLNSFGTSESTTVALWLGASAFEPIIATGGEESEISISGVIYKLHAFTASETFVVSSVGTLQELDYLVVGGGASGARGFPNSACGGGGGAGALRYATGQSITPGSYTVLVGAGGATHISSGNYGNNGSDSSLFGVISNGGGAGATYDDAIGASNGNASGGGAGGAGGSFKAGGIGGDFGNNGGSHTGTGQSNSSTSAGGGGGATGAATGGVANQRGGNGGDGLDLSSLFGTSYGASGVFAGGGGGGASQVGGGFGGAGGGAPGGALNSSGSQGFVNSGAGGGGGSSTTATVNGGAGGSGIVIIRYPITDPN
jgi:hypothetical protein